MIVSLGPDMDLANRVVALEDVLGPFAMELGERLAGPPNSAWRHADQPHFNREFREPVGCAPGQFPFVQDTLAAA